MDALRDLYDKRYRSNYREDLDPYEIARIVALEHFFGKILKLEHVNSMMDYGCGSGLHVELWKRLFPQAGLYFSDISNEALKKLIRKYPEFSDNCVLIENSKASFNSGSFDVIVSIEVMEHVLDLNKYLDDIYRLLKNRGIFIWTTPCANKFSIEHIYSYISKKIERTKEGYKRWKWEDPRHIRRLTTKEIKVILLKIGFNAVGFRFRAHLFSFIYYISSFICSKVFVASLRRIVEKIKEKIGEKLVLLDYILFKRFPNGASMIGCAYKIG